MSPYNASLPCLPGILFEFCYDVKGQEASMPTSDNSHTLLQTASEWESRSKTNASSHPSSYPEVVQQPYPTIDYLTQVLPLKTLPAGLVRWLSG